MASSSSPVKTDQTTPLQGVCGKQTYLCIDYLGPSGPFVFASFLPASKKKKKKKFDEAVAQTGLEGNWQPAGAKPCVTVQGQAPCRGCGLAGV